MRTGFLTRLRERLETSPDSAFVALDSLDRRQLHTREQRARHALLYSIALDKVGIEMTSDSIINIAVDYYIGSEDKERAEEALRWKGIINEKAVLVPDTDTLKRQNARIIQERYADKMRLESNRKSIFLLVSLSAIVLLICLYIIRRTNAKLSRKRRQGNGTHHPKTRRPRQGTCITHIFGRQNLQDIRRGGRKPHLRP